MRRVLAVLLSVLVLTGCSDDKPDGSDTTGKAEDPSVIPELASAQRDIRDFDLCTAVRDIPNIESRLTRLLGVAISDFNSHDGGDGQECYLLTEVAAGDQENVVTFGMSQGLEIATAVTPKHKEIYPGCFAADPDAEPGRPVAQGVRCRPNFSAGLQVGSPYVKWPEHRREYLDLVHDLLVSLSKQG